MSFPIAVEKSVRPHAVAEELELRQLLSGVTFGLPTAYGSGSSLGPALVDLNGDGKPDIVSPNSASGGSDGVTVFLNAGGGVFTSGTDYTTSGSLTGFQPYQVAAGDFNQDGHQDIASANYGSGTLSILFGDGNGALSAPTVYAAGSTPDGIAVGDLNGDGYPDVVVSNRGSDSVSIFMNQGNGTFAAAVNVDLGASPGNVAIGDFNGDGHPDIVTPDGSADQFSVLLNNGNGTFAAPVTVADPNGPYYVAVADMNNDGHADLVATESSNGVGVLLGTGTGSFGAPIFTADAGSLNDLVVADFNADGTNDVAVTNSGANTVDVLLGNGNGTLQAPSLAGTGLASYSVAAADLNADGKPDLVVGSYSPGGSTAAIATLINGGSTAPAPASPTESIGGLDPSFGTAGLASHDVGFNSTSGVATEDLQSVLIGPIGAVGNESFGVTRYNADGSLDTSFGTGGVVSTPFDGTDAVPTSVQVLYGGDILVAGTATTYTNGVSTGSEFAVAEYNAAGTLNTGFGSGGQMLVSFSKTSGVPSNDVLRAVAESAGGLIYLGGSSDAAGAGNTDLAVAALTSAGVPETGFNASGTTLIEVAGGNDQINSLAVQTNGDVVVAGSATVGGVAEVALARLLPSGSLDKNFGVKGIVTDGVGGVYDSASSVVIQPKGQVVIGGLTASGSGSSLSSDFLLQRYTTAGKLDHTFAGGTVTTSFGQPAAVTQVVLQADGSVVASGKTGSTLDGTLDVAVARYTTKGALDSSFGTGGKVVIDLSSGVVATPAAQDRLAAALAAASSSLGTEFDAFTFSLQGVVAVTQGGEILAAGNSGANTVEAELIAAGVDLLTKVLSALPASVLSGTKGKLTVTITESGTTAAKGSVAIALSFATSAAGVDATTPVNFTEKVNLKQGQTKLFKLSFTYPTGLSSGSYFAVADVMNGVGVPADLNDSNNTASAAAAVTIAPAFVALSGANLSSGAILAGKAVTITIDLTNNGNVTARGKSEVDFYLSTDGTVADGMRLGTAALSPGLAVSKSKVYRFKVIAPTAVPTGTFNLLGVIDPGDLLGTDDTVVVSATAVTIG